VSEDRRGSSRFRPSREALQSFQSSR
jgi:hypothetical protein